VDLSQLRSWVHQYAYRLRAGAAAPISKSSALPGATHEVTPARLRAQQCSRSAHTGSSSGTYLPRHTIKRTGSQKRREISASSEFRPPDIITDTSSQNRREISVKSES
jgi:hypothetical protein